MAIFFYTCLALAALLSSAKLQTSASGISPAIVLAKHVPAVVGLPVSIACYAEPGNPLESCRWERLPPPTEKRYVLTLKATNSSSFGSAQVSHGVFDCNCTYKYAGQGLDKGDCTISIHDVNEFHMSKWECTLTGENGHTWIGSLNITRHVSEPFFKDADLLSEIVYNETSPTDVTCCVEAYDPQLSININILLENGQDSPTVFPRGSVQTQSGSIRGEEACRRSKYLFKPEDNGKRVSCVARFEYNSHEYNQTTFLPVNVKYGPRLTANSVEQKLIGNSSLLINATFTANPQPDYVWVLESDPASGASFQIRKDHPKYKTDIKHLQGDYYSATLEILDLEPEDYRRVFLLKLLNGYGEEDLHVYLQNHTIENPVSDWITIYIAVAVVISLIVIAAVVFICIKKRVNRGKYIPAPIRYSKGDNSAD